MNRQFKKGFMLGMFIGFIITSPRRDEWLRKLHCRLTRFRRQIMNGKKDHSL
ncbi:hypothetical protein [Chitinophaga sp. XS-30]|uniref:hypothetical protein n=1 Tax=Chitinophaga sp. XS-30 TaxID=2604421 RepID=UPI00143E0C78|nr:hypothetical protein [Chitinophaga sp. XS-30]